MDIDTIQRVARDLERSLDSWSNWLELATALVVIGLFSEYWYEVKSLFKKRPFERQHLMELAGAILITVGVTGELYFQTKVSAVDTSLRNTTHQIEALLNMQVADANERAAQAELRTTELRAAMADRGLSADQQRRIGAALAKYAGRTVWIRSTKGDGEAMRLGLEIKAALERAHIRTEVRFGEMLFDAPLAFGIQVPCAQRERPFALSLLGALSTIGNLATVPLSEFGCDDEGGTLELDIGIKPAQLAK